MSDTQDIKRVPAWAAFVLGLLGSIVAGAIGYGELQGKATALADRVEKSEQRLDRAEQRLTETSERIHAVDRNIIRICAVLRARCTDSNSKGE